MDVPKDAVLVMFADGRWVERDDTLNASIASAPWTPVAFTRVVQAYEAAKAIRIGEAAREAAR